MARRKQPVQRKRGYHLSPEETTQAKAAFLAAFEAFGIIQDGARAAGVSRDTVTAWRDTDQEFAARFAELLEDSNDSLRREIMRRAYGWLEVTKTVTVDADGGTETKTQRVSKYDSAMLRFIAQARMPEFRDKLDVSAKGVILGASEAMARIADDPDKTGAALSLLESLTTRS